jgi:hypothetical protein
MGDMICHEVYELLMIMLITSAMLYQLSYEVKSVRVGDIS